MANFKRSNFMSTAASNLSLRENRTLMLLTTSMT